MVKQGSVGIDAMQNEGKISIIYSFRQVILVKFIELLGYNIYWYLLVSGLSIAAKGGLEVYVADSNESLLFRMIRNESELKRSLDDDNEDDDSNSFLPEMTHQIYGDK